MFSLDNVGTVSCGCYTAFGIGNTALVMVHVSGYPEGSVNSPVKYKQEGRQQLRTAKKYLLYVTCGNGNTVPSLRGPNIVL